MTGKSHGRWRHKTALRHDPEDLGLNPHRGDYLKSCVSWFSTNVMVGPLQTSSHI